MLLGLLSLLIQSVVHPQGVFADPVTISAVPSEYREGVEVEFLYRQDLEGVYWTTWYGREESRDGNWREVYFETAEKWTTSGIMRFECGAVDSIGDPSVTVSDYDGPDYAHPYSREEQEPVVISHLERSQWQSGELTQEYGYFPPYELFVIAHYRFCHARKPDQ